jgi:hypothetical protein
VTDERQPLTLPPAVGTIRGKTLEAYRLAFSVFLAVIAVGLFFVVSGTAAPSFLLGVVLVDSLFFSAFLIYRAGAHAQAERGKGMILWERRSFWLLNLVWAILTGSVVGIVVLVSLVQALELAFMIGAFPLVVLVMAYVERTARNRKKSRS